MRSLRVFFARLVGVVADRRQERELAEELESHLQLHVDDNLRAGMSPLEARRQALLSLGGLEATKEIYRDRRTIPAVETVIRDVRYAVRMLRKTPGFSLAAVVVLALGIGANTAIFSVVQAVLLRPLPFPEPGRLVDVWHVPPQASFPGMSRFAVSPANYLDWRAQNRVFEAVALRAFRSFNLTGGPEPETLMAEAVSVDFFSLLGVQPRLGRAFLPEEDQPGQGQVVILSDGLWKRRFGSDPAIVGKSISLNGESYAVVGVMPPSFHFPEWADLWTPLAWNAEMWAVRGNHNCRVVARLRPGVDLPEAQAEMTTISRRLEGQYPEDDKGWGAVVVPLHDDLVEDVRPTLLVLLGAVGFVLLIACANVANLVLARTLTRRKEIGLRLALGASRLRVVRQILCETAVLGLAGGLVGLVVASYGVELVVTFLADELKHSVNIGLDGPVLGFALTLSIATGILAGVVPAWRLTRANVSEALKQGLGRTEADAGSARTGAGLVASEVALALVLLLGAGLMIKSLWLLSQVETGIDPGNTLTMVLTIPQTKYPEPDQKARFFDEVLRRAREVPGVERAGLSDFLPFSTDSSHWPVAIEGQPAASVAEQPQVQTLVISPGYLATLRVPVLRGRDFAETDTSDRPSVLLVSESMARRFWPDQDPIGRRLSTVFLPDRSFEVVGVVKDVKLQGLDVTEPVQAMYLPFAQASKNYMELAVRSTGAPSSVLSAVVAAVHDVDPDQPVVEIRTMEEVLEGSFAGKRFTMTLLAAFAGLALLLAAVGIYSVLSYTVRRRLKEIGIRLALGAPRGDALRMVVMDGLKPTLAGVVLGLLAALSLARLLGSLTFGVSAADPLTCVSVSLLLLVVGVLASLIPALRATRVDPVRTLRDD
jgi:putative ABC transport system permease protein